MEISVEEKTRFIPGYRNGARPRPRSQTDKIKRRKMNKMTSEWLRRLAGVGVAVLLLGTLPVLAQAAAPPLGVAASFAVLGGSTVTIHDVLSNCA